MPVLGTPNILGEVTGSSSSSGGEVLETFEDTIDSSGVTLITISGGTSKEVVSVVQTDTFSGITSTLYAKINSATELEVGAESGELAAGLAFRVTLRTI
jgi:phage tail sheath gpL-like